MRQKKQQQGEQNQERIQEEAFQSSFDRSKTAKQDNNKDTLLFPIPKPKAMQTPQPPTVQEETAFEAVQRNMKACKRKLQEEILLSSEEEESAEKEKVEKEKVDRSTLQDFCMHMSDEEILSNRNMVPTWGLTKEAARNLLNAKRAKKKDLTTKPTGV